MSKVLSEPRRLPETGNDDATTDSGSSEAPWLALVADKVKTLHYGVVQIVVHDSRVVQVERTERHRFDVQRGA